MVMSLTLDGGGGVVAERVAGDGGDESSATQQTSGRRLTRGARLGRRDERRRVTLGVGRRGHELVEELEQRATIARPPGTGTLHLALVGLHHAPLRVRSSRMLLRHRQRQRRQAGHQRGAADLASTSRP